MKKCYKCKKLKPLTDFYKGCDECKICKKEIMRVYMRKYRLTHPRNRENERKYHLTPIGRAKARIRRVRYLKNNPWILSLYWIKRRCNYPKQSYFARGIKCLITSQEVKQLWFRDKAYLMKRPSVDRINSLGNYTFENCRYMELIENQRRKKEYILLVKKFKKTIHRL